MDYYLGQRADFSNTLAAATKKENTSLRSQQYTYSLVNRMIHAAVIRGAGLIFCLNYCTPTLKRFTHSILICNNTFI